MCRIGTFAIVQVLDGQILESSPLDLRAGSLIIFN